MAFELVKRYEGQTMKVLVENADREDGKFKDAVLEINWCTFWAAAIWLVRPWTWRSRKHFLPCFEENLFKSWKTVWMWARSRLRLFLRSHHKRKRFFIKTTWCNFFLTDFLSPRMPPRPFLLLKDQAHQYTLPVAVSPIDAGVALSQSDKTVLSSSPHKFTALLMQSLGIEIKQAVFVEIKGSHQYLRLCISGHSETNSAEVTGRWGHVIVSVLRCALVCDKKLHWSFTHSEYRVEAAHKNNKIWISLTKALAIWISFCENEAWHTCLISSQILDLFLLLQLWRRCYLKIGTTSGPRLFDCGLFSQPACAVHPHSDRSWEYQSLVGNWRDLSAFQSGFGIQF